ncbi:hypothetical protein UYSO10_5897 [Kosakonia radicincitans]|uniref:hypothetical protein n=1 Tax=Kosakonia radicincitans TaxID=283686 RepID=UPI0011823FBB|nr:hypothetical protein [Kosakonia radicincitans]VVT43401.1 hypothetical protein UYSO10_5897 [Kosakonia radicincitans]
MTDNDEIRDDFETWVESEGEFPGGFKKLRRTNGGYSLQVYSYAWTAWQACSDADKAKNAQLRQRIAELEARNADIGLAHDTLTDRANMLADHCDHLLTHNRKMEELLIRLQKSKPGGVYFNKWDIQISNVLAGINPEGGSEDDC